MDASEVLKLGPLQIPISYLLLIVGLVISAFITEKLARKRDWEKEKWTDLLIVLLFIFIILYKFGWIIFDIKSVIQNPASIIWTSGSSLGTIMAVIITILVFVYKIKKKKFPVFDVLDFSWITVTITLFMYNLIIMDYGKATTFIFGVSLPGESNYLYHPINWYIAVFLSILLILRFVIWSKLTYVKLMYLYILLGSGLLLVSIFDVSINLYLGFTINQLAFLSMALVGGIGLIRKDL